MKTSRPAWSQPSARPTRSPPRCGPLDGLYAAFVFSRDLGRFIRPGMSEAHFRFLTQRSDPGPGWPERKPQRRRLPRRERPEAAYQKETGRRRPLSDEISGYEKALQLRARYSKAVVA